MPFTFIARMKIFPEKKDQFITACEKLENAVKAVSYTHLRAHET